MMKKRVLVLNQDFSPISICTIQRAFLLVYLEKADLVTEMKAVKHYYEAGVPARVGIEK